MAIVTARPTTDQAARMTGSSTLPDATATVWHSARVMHPGQLSIDAGTVDALLASQFPQWSGLG